MKLACLALLLFAVLALAAIVLMPHQRHSARVSAPKTSSSAPVALPTVASTAPTPQELARRAARYPDFKPHPFVVTRETSAFGWTAEDGKNPDVIKQLAHNELEFERLAGESARILRRQLVYHKDTADMQIERAKSTGDAVQQFMLPGLDGQEVPFQITRSELSASGQSGAFTGEISGKPGSMVTFAFKGGREAFTVSSPADNLYLVGEPREPGELIVKSIDPATYVAGICGNP